MGCSLDKDGDTVYRLFFPEMISLLPWVGYRAIPDPIMARYGHIRSVVSRNVQRTLPAASGIEISPALSDRFQIN